jgi:hypothetical protein
MRHSPKTRSVSATRFKAVCLRQAANLPLANQVRCFVAFRSFTTTRRWIRTSAHISPSSKRELLSRQHMALTWPVILLSKLLYSSTYDQPFFG